MDTLSLSLSLHFSLVFLLYVLLSGYYVDVGGIDLAFNNRQHLVT